MSGDWATPSKWSRNVVPNEGDNVLFNLVGPYTVSSFSDETINAISLAPSVILNIDGGSGFVVLNGTGTAASSGTIIVRDNSSFEIGGTFKNVGAISLASTGDTTELIVDGNVSLMGGGRVRLGAAGGSAIVSNGSTAMLTNVNNTIIGSGSVGDENLTIDNQSHRVIKANTSQMITLSGNVANQGTLQALGGLTINSDVDNTGGNIQALQTGSVIILNGAKITGGSISTVAGSAIGGDGEIDALKFINAGAIYSETQGLPAATLVINSPLINNGIIRAGTNGNSSGASLIINGTVTGTGSAIINGADELEVSSAFADNIRFARGATGTLKLDAPAGFTRSVHGFAQGSIDLPHIGFGAGTTLSYTANRSNTGGTLHVSDGINSADIRLAGHFQSAGFKTAMTATAVR